MRQGSGVEILGPGEPCARHRDTGGGSDQSKPVPLLQAPAPSGRGANAGTMPAFVLAL